MDATSSSVYLISVYHHEMKVIIIVIVIIIIIIIVIIIVINITKQNAITFTDKFLWHFLDLRYMLKCLGVSRYKKEKRKKIGEKGKRENRCFVHT